jgi:hypothetical protein
LTLTNTYTICYSVVLEKSLHPPQTQILSNLLGEEFDEHPKPRHILERRRLNANHKKDATTLPKKMPLMRQDCFGGGAG